MDKNVVAKERVRLKVDRRGIDRVLEKGKGGEAE